MNKRVAIIDVGSARIKMQIITYDLEGKAKYISYKDDTFLSSHVINNNLDEKYFHDTFVPKIEEFANKAREHGCNIIIPIGTHIFRTINNIDYYLESLKPILGLINIIDSKTEGLVFFNRMREITQEENFALLDIGGGSVQIINSKDKDVDILSIPTGTFTLEKEFQASKEVATENELGLMSSYIKENLKDKCDNWQNETLIFGSNCMEDFISSVFKNVNIFNSEDNSYTLDKYIYLFEKIKNIPYKEIHSLYPENPYFMNGADKLLINLIIISKILGAKRIVPTNESLSTSFLNLASTNLSSIKNLGVKYFEL